MQIRYYVYIRLLRAHVKFRSEIGKTAKDIRSILFTMHTLYIRLYQYLVCVLNSQSEFIQVMPTSVRAFVEERTPSLFIMASYSIVSYNTV